MSQSFRELPRRLLLCAAFLGVGATTGSATAQQAGAPADADTEPQAGLLYREGVKAAGENRLEDARVLLLASWRLKQHWQIAANLGDAELALGRHRDAAEHLDYFLRTGTSITGDERKRGQEMLARARAKVGTLLLRVSVGGAEVFVNGLSVGKSPLPSQVYVDPGPVVVEARLAGHSLAQASAELIAGSTKTMALQLKPMETGEAPLGPRRTELPSAPTLGTGRAGPSRALLVVGGVTSALALGAGAATWAAGVKKESTGLSEDRSAAGTLLNASTVSFAVGGVVGVGTILYAIAKSGSAPERRIEAGFIVTQNAGGVVLGKRW